MGPFQVQLLALGILLSTWFTRAVAATDRDVLVDWQTWGPYRPNLYFGVRPQIPETLLMGLMWASGDDRYRLTETIRDTCEQNDGMKGYGWTMYDPRVGGSQAIHDEELGVDLTTDFLKTEDGHGWTVRVAGTPRPGAPTNLKTSIIFHLALEGMDASKEKTLYSVKSAQVPEDKIWQAKSVYIDLLDNDDSQDYRKVVPSSNPHHGNVHFVHFNFIGSFVATFTYGHSPNVTRLSDIRSTFPSQVDKAFPRASQFQEDKYADFSQAVLSNLLGGLAFLHGDSKVDFSSPPDYEEADVEFWQKEESAVGGVSITTTGPTSLLSFTPSRPSFPRGFLWDEGFHLLPVMEWDLDLAVSVFRSWLDQMDKNGWIAREQVLGPEARSRMTPQFQTQYPHHANPPTLLVLALPSLLQKLTGESSYSGLPSKYLAIPNAGKVLLKQLYPLLDKHYQWLRRTQAGDFTAYPRPEGAAPVEGYRWRGRTPKHTLASGLDDYPRANPPHPGELHADALAWVGASAYAMMQLAQALGELDAADSYRKQLDAARNNLDVLHWDESQKSYCDATIVGTDPTAQYQHICHLGYVSIFPLIMGLVNADHPHVPAVLDLLSDETKLLSPFGLRSLSKADHLYRKDEDHWRGTVWMNLNVLAVQRLRTLGMQGQPDPPTPAQEKALSLAADLRDRVVKTVYESYEETGFVWGQYDDKTGKGRHSRASTGWTACVILLMGLEFTRDRLAHEADELHGDDSYLAALPTSGMTTRTASATLAVVLVVLLFRRRLMGLVAYMGTCLGVPGGPQGRGGRSGEAIDLDGRER
ncbi:Processing alpha glucosidase I [Cytospora paraplurivora]|uniref:Mannosyl-oligosaccharide glucosidase n=1 Tax=Cytospora paraplurivora TaxID=2898453 RepID=A0AAN9UE19_9PEZI